MRMKDYSAGMWCTECPTLLKEANIGRLIYLQCSQRAADPCSTETFTLRLSMPSTISIILDIKSE